MEHEQAYAICNTCTIMLVKKTYEKIWWFRFVREPLKWCMVLMGILYHIDTERYPVRTEQCRGCLRFMKTALKDRSALFRLLNGLVNPVFDRIMEQIVTADDTGEAKRHASKSTHPVPGTMVKQ
jgi:hypothetical protein